MIDKKLYRVLIRMNSGEDHALTAAAVYMDKFHIMVTLAGRYNLEDVIVFDRDGVLGCTVWPL